MKQILVLVATGFEDTELITTLNVLNRENITYDLVSIENKEQVKGQNEALVNTLLINNIEDLSNYQGLFLPGGQGHKLLLEDAKVLEIVKKYNEDKKIIAAICAAPELLKKTGVAKGKTITAYPGFATGDNNTGKEVVLDGHILTGRDYQATHRFANELVKKIKIKKIKSI